MYFFYISEYSSRVALHHYFMHQHCHSSSLNSPSHRCTELSHCYCTTHHHRCCTTHNHSCCATHHHRCCATHHHRCCTTHHHRCCTTHHFRCCTTHHHHMEVVDTSIYHIDSVIYSVRISNVGNDINANARMNLLCLYVYHFARKQCCL